MSRNRGVVYIGPGKVEVNEIPFPDMGDPAGRRANHGIILKVVSTNICGSDQHMVRRRTTAPQGLVLGHEITGEVIEVGSDVLGPCKRATLFLFRSTSRVDDARCAKLRIRVFA